MDGQRIVRAGIIVLWQVELQDVRDVANCVLNDDGTIDVYFCYGTMYGMEKDQ